MAFNLGEVASFVVAAAAALGRILIGRWPEPPGRDYLAPKGPSKPAPTERLHP